MVGTGGVAGGSWSFQVPGDLAEGAHTLKAVITDAAGNEGTAATFGRTVDLRAPVSGNAVGIAAYSDDIGTITGTFGAGTSTDDTQPLLSGTVSGLAAGDVVRIYDGTTLLGTASVAVGNWSFQVPGDLAEGAHTLQAVITDAAGKEVTAGTFGLTVDLTPPLHGTLATFASYGDDIGTITGTFGAGTSTDDTQPLLSGTVSGLAAGDVVRIYDGTT